MKSEDSSRAFEKWFCEDDYGGFGGTRELYLFDDIKSGANPTIIRKWLESAFSVGYENGKLDSKNQ